MAPSDSLSPAKTRALPQPLRFRYSQPDWIWQYHCDRLSPAFVTRLVLPVGRPVATLPTCVLESLASAHALSRLVLPARLLQLRPSRLPRRGKSKAH